MNNISKNIIYSIFTIIAIINLIIFLTVIFVHPKHTYSILYFTGICFLVTMLLRLLFYSITALL